MVYEGWPVILTFALLIPLFVVILDGKVKYAIASFSPSFLLPIASYYVPIDQVDIFDIVLNNCLVLIGGFLLSEIKIYQYKLGIISKPKMWFANVFILLWACVFPILRMMWGGFYEREGSSHMLVVTNFMLIPSITTGLLFFMSSSRRIWSFSKENKKISLKEILDTSQFPRPNGERDSIA